MEKNNMKDISKEFRKSHPLKKTHYSNEELKKSTGGKVDLDKPTYQRAHSMLKALRNKTK
jgi:hypothetical protein